MFNRDRLGNDDMVVPMHGAEKEIDFNTVDESSYNPATNEIQKQKSMEGGANKLSNLPISQRTCAEKL
jgi:hypothetical protein